MSSELQFYQLDELCEFINGFAFKSSDYVEPSAETVEVLRMGYICRGGGFKEDSTPVFVPRKYGRNLDKYFLKPGDVVIAMTDMKDKVAILANTAWISHADRFVLNQRVGCIRVKRPDILNSRFFYFYSNSLPHVTYLRTRANSGVQVNLSTSAIKESMIQVPPLQDQLFIADLLGALDDRITLLRETNATLEAIAQALFKSWFVDFDPVRAKAEGRQPEGMDSITAALFPDSFEDSEMGLVPSGWAVGVLGDITSIKGGKQLEKELFDDRGLNPIFGGAGIMGHTDLKNAQGFVITVGRVGAYCGQFFWHIGEAWVNNNASHIQPMRNLDAVWIYQWLRATNIDHIKKGAAQPFVSNGDLAELKLALPIGELVDRFVEVVGSVYEQMVSLQAQAQTLTQLRDTLLPRLISGQLRLPDAKQVVEKALA